MGFLPGKSSPIAAILSVFALAVLVYPASGNELVASSNHFGKMAEISDLRVGAHSDKTRIVLDVSYPTDLSYKVSSDGKTLQLDLPYAAWNNAKTLPRHLHGTITSFSHSASDAQECTRQ